MEKSFYILISDIKSLSSGSIFEYYGGEQLRNIDDHSLHTQTHDILKVCKRINRRSALLLRPIDVENRVKIFNSFYWNNLSNLDVGDDCIYLMGSTEIRCSIMSKGIGKNGIMLTVNLENGTTLDTSIDRLKCLKNTEISLLNEFGGSEKVRTKSLISTYEDLNKPIRIQSETGNPLIKFSNKGLKCKCFKNIFKSVEKCAWSIEERDKFFNNLFKCLPEIVDDYDGRCSLHWASYYILIEPVKTLITIKNFINKKDKHGNSPLHIAISTPLSDSKEVSVKRNQEAIVKLFLSNKADLNIKNNQDDTSLTIAFKSGNFSLLETIFENTTAPIVLSNHLLSKHFSILECLIKLEKQVLACICFSKSLKRNSENDIFLKSTFYAFSKNYRNLALEIIEHCKEKNNLLPDGETLLTKLFNDKLIHHEDIYYLISNFTFDLAKQNASGEYPLLLACRRIYLDPVKFILNKISTNQTQLDDCLDEVIMGYTNVCINHTYKTNTPTNNSVVSPLKKVAFEIVDLLIKAGATIYSRMSTQEAIETCIDQDFTKVVKHLCLKRTDTVINKIDSGLSKKSESKDNINECSICMDRVIDCSFSCGHTYCFKCADNFIECPSCRKVITEKRKIYFS